MQNCAKATINPSKDYITKKKKGNRKMDKNRKRLKEYSLVILILVAFSVVRMIVDACLYGFGVVPIFSSCLGLYCLSPTFTLGLKA